MNLVSKEVAELEVTKWLDFKKVSETKREANKESIKSLCEAVSDGSLTLNDDNKFIHKLKFPIENNEGIVTVSELKYKPRLTTKNVKPYLSSVKATDVDGRIMAYVCALTENSTNIIAEIDTEDYSVCQSIAIFFL
jgi:hypothetical protein